MKPVASAKVLANPKKKQAKQLKKEVLKFLKDQGIKTRAKEPDIAIMISGDGTILYNKQKHNAPIFGIGSYTSFICQSTNLNWKTKLSKVLKGRYEIQERSMLECMLNGKKLPPALNEYCIKTTGARVIRFTLSFEKSIDKRKIDFKADGVIFSTPTGSTAYAYSCGGKELEPNSEKYEIVAIAPFRRNFDPMVLDDRVVSNLSIETDQKMSAIVDGQSSFPLKKGKNSAKIFKSEDTVSVISIK